MVTVTKASAAQVKDFIKKGRRRYRALWGLGLGKTVKWYCYLGAQGNIA